jgi:hypothetical protein
MDLGITRIVDLRKQVGGSAQLVSVNICAISGDHTRW